MRQKVSRTMSNYYIRSLQHALDIIAAYEHCGSCDRCPLSTPEGWRCSYLYGRRENVRNPFRLMSAGQQPAETQSRPIRDCVADS